MPLIETMPAMFGQQFYPNGFPLPAHKISVNGKTVQQIFVDLYKDSGTAPADDPQLEIINDYYRYHLLAPCWQLGDWVTEEQIMAADHDELFEICMDTGIDPI